MGKRAVFFCSAVKDIDPAYNQAARECVRAACAAGYGIVSGGTTKGTMDVVCRAAHEFGAVENISIIPRFMEGLENKLCTEIIWTDTMAERKELMRKGVSLVVLLPGGIGSLDEFAETYTLIKLKRMEARLVVVDVNGFYQPLKALLQHYVNTNMLPAESLEEVIFVPGAKELAELISE